MQVDRIEAASNWSVLSLILRTAYFEREECVMREDKEHAVLGAAEHQVDGAFRHIDFGDLLAHPVIDKDLSVGHIDIPAGIDGDALAAALGKDFQIRQRAISAHYATVGTILGSAADINSLTGSGAYKAIRVEVVREAPTR